MLNDSPVECPYRGLQPYTEAEREYFFGRERDKIVIASNLIASPLTILYGGSGVGKTSVLLAAAVPHLRTIPNLTTIIFREWQGGDFAAALRRAVLDAVGGAAALGGEAADPQLPLDELLLRCARGTRGRLLLIFDQFEEYFLNPASLPQVEWFEAEFARVVNRRDIDAHFLLSLREEELSKLDRFQGRIPNLLNNRLRIERLDRAAAADAIRKPLERYNRKFSLPEERGVTIEGTLVKALLDKATPGQGVTEGGMPPPPDQLPVVSEDGVETPVLQLLLTRLWAAELKQGSNKLRLQTFDDQLGGAEKIVSAYLNEVMSGLSTVERDVAASIFKYLVTPSGTKIAMDPKTLAWWAGLSGEQAEKQVTDLLEKLSSYQPRPPRGDPHVPQQDVRILRKVTAPRQPDRYEIFHDALGVAVRDWRAEHLQARLTGAEKGKRWLTFTVMALVLLGAFITWQAIYARRLAQEAEVNNHKANVKLNEVTELYGVVRALDRSIPFQQAVMRGHSAQVNSASLGAGGRLLVTGGADNSGRVWDAQAGELKGLLLAHTGPVVYATFNGEGNYIVTASVDRTARVWETEGGRQLLTLEGHEAEVSYAAFAPGGRVVTASQDSTARVWDAQSGALQHTLRGHTGPINSAALGTADGNLLVTAGADGTARLWDVAGGAQLHVLQVGQYVEVARAAFSRDGSLVVTAHSNGTAAVWSVADGSRLRTLEGHEGPVKDAAFSPDGRLVVTAGADKTARLWEAGTGTLLRTLQGHTGEVNHAAFGGDGAWVVSVSQDKAARLWEAGSGRMLAVLLGHTDAVAALDVSHPGSLIATASRDKTARVWNVGELSTIRVAQLSLGAEPSSYAGRCPVTVKFTGSIAVVGSGGKVKYQFVHSSAGRKPAPVQELTFDAPGVKEVSDTRRVPGVGPVRGWATLRILEPQEAESDKAEFRLLCAQPTPTPEDETPSPPDEQDGVTPYSIMGRVTDEAGAPVPNALVQVSRFSPASSKMTRSDARGVFKVYLPSWSPQAIIITVTATGYYGSRRVVNMLPSMNTGGDFVLRRRPPPTPQPSP